MWARFLDRINGRAKHFLKPGSDGISDHNMNLYVNHIEKAIKSSV